MKYPAALLALLLASAAPPALRAQTPGDTASLVSAVTRVVVERVIPAATRGDHTWLGQPRSGFDSLVVAAVARETGLRVMEVRPDTADWVVTRGAVVRGDSADVLVQVGTHARGDPRDLIDTYVETRRYRFARGERGWVFLRQEFVEGADFGPVRG